MEHTVYTCVNLQLRPLVTAHYVLEWNTQCTRVYRREMDGAHTVSTHLVANMAILTEIKFLRRICRHCCLHPTTLIMQKIKINNNNKRINTAVGIVTTFQQRSSTTLTSSDSDHDSSTITPRSVTLPSGEAISIRNYTLPATCGHQQQVFRNSIQGP